VRFELLTRFLVARFGFALLVVPVCWSQTQPTSLQPPKIELHARAVDGIDLLGTLVSTTPFSLVAVRDGSADRIDIATRAVSMEQVWDDIISRVGMTRVVQNNTEVVVNACRMPLQAHPGLALDKDEPITLNFNEIATDEFFALMARVLDLELSAPDGLPASAPERTSSSGLGSRRLCT
jgi:hypothetical protein